MGFGSIARRFSAMRSDRRHRLVGLSIALVVFGFVLPNAPASGQVPPGILPPGHTYTDAQAQWLVNGVRYAEQVLPQYYGNRAALPGMGYVNIGVLSAGREHWVNVNMFNDEHFLNPRYPESLVLRNGQVEAAMLFTNSNITMETIPEIVRFIPGWHGHPELCSDEQGRVIGFNPGTGCAVGRPATVPMVHVWITDPGCNHRFGGLGVGGLQCNYEDHSGDDHSMPTTTAPAPTTTAPAPTTTAPAPTTTMPPMDHGDHGEH